MAQVAIPELTQFQADVIISSSEGQENQPFIVLEPTAHDEPAIHERLTQEMREIEGLLALGFLKDASERFQDSITATYEEKQVKFRVVQLEENTYRMFHDGPRQCPWCGREPLPN